MTRWWYLLDMRPSLLNISLGEGLNLLHTNIYRHRSTFLRFLSVQCTNRGVPFGSFWCRRGILGGGFSDSIIVIGLGITILSGSVTVKCLCTRYTRDKRYGHLVGPSFSLKKIYGFCSFRLYLVFITVTKPGTFTGLTNDIRKRFHWSSQILYYVLLLDRLWCRFSRHDHPSPSDGLQERRKPWKNTYIRFHEGTP